MSDAFPLVSLRHVVAPIERSEKPSAGTTYRQVGVRLWGEGAYERETMDGGQTRYATLSRVEADDIIVNKIWARNGSVAVVPPTLAGAYVSGEFPTFVPIRTRLDPRWFHWLTKTVGFWEQCDEKSRGTSGKNRIRPERFLEIPIPLPPLTEQRRIVVRIEELAAKIAEARGLRRQAMEEADTLLPSAGREVFAEAGKSFPIRPMKGTFRFRNDLIRPADGETGTVRFVGLQHVESGTGRRLGEELVQAESLDGRKFRFAPGEIIYGYLRPYLNKVWIADREGICSVDQYVLHPHPSAIDTAYLAHYMRSPIFVEQAHLLTNNLMLPRLRSGLLESIEMPQPPLYEQRQMAVYLDEMQSKVDAVKRLQAETAAELDALLPSVLDRAFRGEL